MDRSKYWNEFSLVYDVLTVYKMSGIKSFMTADGEIYETTLIGGVPHVPIFKKGELKYFVCADKMEDWKLKYFVCATSK